MCNNVLYVQCPVRTCILHYRETVQMLLSVLDPADAARRKGHRLKCQNKVRPVRLVNMDTTYI